MGLSNQQVAALRLWLKVLSLMGLLSHRRQALSLLQAIFLIILSYLIFLSFLILSYPILSYLISLWKVIRHKEPRRKEKLVSKLNTWMQPCLKRMSIMRVHEFPFFESASSSGVFFTFLLTVLLPPVTPLSNISSTQLQNHLSKV